MNFDQIKIGNFIAKLRKSKGMTQDQLAERVGVSRQAVGYWETGKELPNNQNLEKLSKLLDVTNDEILNGEFKNIKKKKVEFNKKLLLFLFLTVILFILVIFLFTSRSSMYKITGSSENITIKNGILIVKKDEVYFSLGNIDYTLNKDIKDLKLYTLNNKKEVKIYSCENCSNLNIILEDHKNQNTYFDTKNIKSIINNLFLKVVYDDDNYEIIDLSFKKSFQKTKVMNNEVDSLTNEKIVKDKKNDILILIKENFNKQEDGYVFSNDKYEICYMDDTIILDIKLDDQNSTEVYTYSLIDDYLNYEQYKNDDLIENQNFSVIDNLNNSVIKNFYKVFEEII